MLSHLGFPQDVRLAGEVPGIDILLSGHTHNRLERPAVVNGAVMIQSGCHGSFTGQLDVTVSAGRLTAVEHRLIAVDASLPADPEMSRMVDAVMAPHRHP